MSDEPTHEIVLRKEMQDALTTILAQEQDSGYYTSLANANPEKWMKAAAVIMAGGRPFDLRRDMGMNRETANKLYGLISTTDEAKLFRKERASQLAYQTANTAQLQDKIIEHLLSDEAEEAIKAMGPKELQQLALAQKLSHEQFERITGNNVTKVEITHKHAPEEYDEAREKLRQRIEASKQAEVIDIEDES